jgi:hypothetical protein
MANLEIEIKMRVNMGTRVCGVLVGPPTCAAALFANLISLCCLWRHQLSLLFYRYISFRSSCPVTAKLALKFRTSVGGE